MGSNQDIQGPPADGHFSGEEFSAAVTAMTSAFGDPTRRKIYLFVREATDGCTAAQVAQHFDLHANVARHHLDKLAGGGYLEVFLAPPSGGAGRPSKRYRPLAVAPLEAPSRSRNDLLLLLLGEALSLLPPSQAEHMAEKVGEDYGRSLAAQMSAGESQRSSRAALAAVADALTAHGFEAHAESTESALTLVQESCPFLDTARRHPVICAVDRGMVRGMLAGLSGQCPEPVPCSSQALGDQACVTFV